MISNDNADRAGKYIVQIGGYKAFIPKQLPPDPPIKIDEELLQLHSQADIALGRLSGTSEILPNPDLFVAMYIHKEAVLSSQIEGTQASLIDVLAFEADAALPENPQDIEEVVNYIRALNYGLQRFDTLPLSLRLIREIHAQLLAGVRGSDRHPGDFRTSQNWIGHLGCSIQTARFVPPPVSDMHTALNNLEAFLHTNTMPILLKVGVVHAQFEIIHPFLDGNGRIGRLLIILILCYGRILSKPLLYLSYFFKLNRLEYYQHLRKVHDEGDWEAWLKFFLRGIYEVAQEATITAQRIVQLREFHRDIIAKNFSRSSGHAYQLLEYLYQRPIITINSAIKATGISYANANKLVTKFQEYGILREIDHILRNRRFVYTQYLALFASGDELQTNFSISDDIEKNKTYSSPD